MSLTDLEIRSAKAGERIVKLSDGGGLQLWITPDGAKRWRLAYRFGGSQKTLAVGVYPQVGLKEAREARSVAKKHIENGRDPSAVKKQAKAAAALSAANTFDAITAELIDKKRKEGKSENTLGKVEWLLGFASAEFGSRPIAEISAPEVLRVLRSVEARGRLETANRLRATIGQVFRYAVATGRADGDPTAALRGAIASPVVRHRSAIISPRAFGGLLRAIDDYDGAPETIAALELIALTFVRPGELRAAEWSEFDLDAAVWVIPAGKTKMRKSHRVPLSGSALAVIRRLSEINGGGKFLFPSARSPSRPISENTLNAALRRMGFGKDEMTAHGFRSAASSILNESGLWHPDAIERQLAHADEDKVRRAYARADFWDERVKMMSWWADKCSEFRLGGKVVPLRA